MLRGSLLSIEYRGLELQACQIRDKKDDRLAPHDLKIKVFIISLNIVSWVGRCVCAERIIVGRDDKSQSRATVIGVDIRAGRPHTPIATQVAYRLKKPPARRT